MGKRSQTTAVHATDPFGFGAVSSIPASVFKAGRSGAAKRAAAKKRVAAAKVPPSSSLTSTAVNSPVSSPVLKSARRHAAAFAPKTSTPMGLPAAVAAGKRAGQLSRPSSRAGARTSTPVTSGRPYKLGAAGRGVGVAGKENSASAGGRRSTRGLRPSRSGSSVVAAPSPLNLSDVLPADASAMDTSVYDIEVSPTAKPASPKSRKSRKGTRKGKKAAKDTSRTWEAKLHFEDSPTKKAGADPNWAKTKDDALSKLRAQFASIDDHSFEEELI